MQSLSSSPLLPTAGYTWGECILAPRGALWKLPIVSERSSVSGGAWVCPLRCRSWEIAVVAWLPSCACCPPCLNRCTRRRVDLEPVGGSGVDIVSFLLFSVGVCLCVSRICVSSSFVSGFLCSLSYRWSGCRSGLISVVRWMCLLAFRRQRRRLVRL